jgi:hypothetical protein
MNIPSTCNLSGEPKDSIQSSLGEKAAEDRDQVHQLETPAALSGSEPEGPLSLEPTEGKPIQESTSTNAVPPKSITSISEPNDA